MKEKYTDKILIVDDEDNILTMLRRTIGREYLLFTANCSKSALAILQEHPDIAVIMSDYNMPGSNGVEFLKQAHDLSPDSVQIMLTGNIELDVAIKAINETDLFRYLPKPCPTKVLGKIIRDALNHYHLIKDKQRLTQELELKNLELARQKYLLAYELDMAKTIYSKIIDYSYRDVEGLNYIIEAQDIVGGDFILTHISKDRPSLYIMMGDIAGHSLQSALAVLLATEVFEAVCATNPSIEHLAHSLNFKMCRKLPIGLFCAALMIKLDTITGDIQVWQGGMPDVYLLDGQGRIIKTLASKNLPLGVVDEQDFTGSATGHCLDEATFLFAYSDGVTEQLGSDQSMFGSKRLQAALLETPPNINHVEFVRKHLKTHQNNLPQSDDISLLELNLPCISKALTKT